MSSSLGWNAAVCWSISSLFLAFLWFSVLAIDLIDQGGNRLKNAWKNIHKHDLDLNGHELRSDNYRGLVFFFF
jgi:hypothetical protein